MRVMEEKSSKRVLIQAMYSSEKLKTLRVDRVILKMMESKALALTLYNPFLDSLCLYGISLNSVGPVLSDVNLS